MIPFIPQSTDTNSVTSKLSSLFDAESLIGLFTDTCDTKKDITNQIPLWVVFEKEELEDAGKTPISIFDLIQKYYDWLYCDAEGGSEYQLGLKLLDLIDIDKTREAYVGRLAGIYADGLSSSSLVPYGGKIEVDNARNFIHSVRKNFHQKKTTIDGIRYFFKTLFAISQEDVKVELPKKYLLRLNGGRFYNEIFSFPGGTGSYDVLQTLSGSCLNFSRMQDGNFYQDYSYLLKVGIKSSYYKDTYKTLAHPAGLKVIYEKTLEDYSGSQTDYDLSEVCERTFIRNYAPYGFSYDYTNDQIDFTQGKAIYGLKPCTGCDDASYGTLASPTFAFPNWANSNITGYNFKDIPLSYFFDLCYDNTETTSPNTGLTCTECNVSFTTQFDTTFKYLINRYEPGWSAATETAGRSATLELLGISAAANPFTIGGAVMSAFQFVAHPGTSGASAGWFNPIIHPRTYATSVRTAYRPFERARSPEKANLKFVEWYDSTIAQDVYYDVGGPANTFFDLSKNFRYQDIFNDPARHISKIISLNLTTAHANGVQRYVMHNPYGYFQTPQTTSGSGEGKWRSFPWMTRNYAGDHFRFDQYLIANEKATLRDLLLDPIKTRLEDDGILVDGVGDIHLNTTYSELTYPAGYVAIFPSYTRQVGYTQAVSVGSPWIPYTDGITWSNGWFGSGLVLNFNERTMVMNNGNAFSKTPPNLVGDFIVTGIPAGYWNGLSDNPIGLSYPLGERLIADLDLISNGWNDKIEFIGYLGNLPYGPIQEYTIPWMLYKDPTIPSNVEYFNWRLNASVSHWKDKFKSPHDGFAHIFMDASAPLERTFHLYQAPGYTAWRNITPSGISYVENIPVTWFKDQYNYTRGSSADANSGVIMGVETFGQYMFKHDIVADGTDPTNTEQSRYLGDPNPRHWCLDDNIAADLWSNSSQMLLGQRKRGFTYSDSIWKRGICGTSDLGEIFASENPRAAQAQTLDGYPFFYNSFIELNAGILRYKKISGTYFDANGGVPWNYDRRFRLFYLYPTLLALNMSILDYIHSGLAYFASPYSTPHSGWYDRTLGLTYMMGMEDNVAPYDPTIYTARNSIWVASLAPTDPTIATDVSGAENMGDVNTYDYVKPMVHVFDCAGDGGYENSTAQNFVDRVSGCPTRIANIVSKLNALPPGKKMYYLTRYNQGPIYNEVADRFANGKQSPWADAAGITLTNDWNIVANYLETQGANPDYITLDLEQTGEFFNSKYQGDGVGGAVTPVSSDWTAQVFGITSDANYNLKWKGATFSSLTTDNGNYPFGITHIVNGAFHPQTDKNYLYWDRAVRAIGSALIKDTITSTTNGIWENASVSNYGDMIIHPGTNEEAYNHNGHPYMQETLSGDASSPELYGSWDFPDSYGVLTSDPTRIVRIDYATTTPFPNTAWNNLLIMIHTLRTARRNTTGKLRPWISTKYWSGGGGFLPQWNTSDQSRKLYNEMIRHCCLTGIEAFLILNNFGGSTDRTTAVNELNNLMIEVNSRLGGAISKTIDSSRIDFTKRVLISGAPTTNGTILWRVTPQEENTNLVDSNNAPYTMLDGGMWMNTDLYSKVIATTNTNGTITISVERNTYHPIVSETPFANRRSPLTPPQNYWNETPEASEFELLYTCMKGGITMGLNSLHFNKLFLYLYERGATGFEES